MSASARARNTATDALRAAITHVSVHTQVTNDAGSATEATGGSPAYARKAVTFNASGAVGPLGAGSQPAIVGLAWSDLMTFDLPVGTYLSWGTWDGLTAGNYYEGGNFDTPYTPTGQATFAFAIAIRANVGG